MVGGELPIDQRDLVLKQNLIVLHVVKNFLTLFFYLLHYELFVLGIRNDRTLIFEFLIVEILVINGLTVVLCVWLFNIRF